VGETITFDERDWPVMVIRFSGAPTDAEFEAYLERYDTYLNRTDRYGLIMVTEPNTPMTKSKHARMQAAWIKERFARLSDRCVGIAFVLPSPMMRGVLKAILAMQTLPVPYAVSSGEESAAEWVRSRLAAAGLAATGTR
jgi:hypothetical protein